MGLDFSTLVYLPAHDMFARDVTVTPIKSNPSASAYVARGIFSTRQVDVFSEMAVLSDQQTILDIREIEFLEDGHVLPQQGDLINIPADGNVPDEGDWEVTDSSRNGGGETTLVIRKWGVPAP